MENWMFDNKVVPLFKYIGGKSWLKEQLNKDIDEILSQHPEINTYVEPFAGGLGAFLGVHNTLLKHNIKNVIINDINHKIIVFYGIVQTNPDGLINEYINLEKGFINTIPQECLTLHKVKDKDRIKELLQESANYYLSVRSSFNTELNTLKMSAQFLFLQHHCFNGIYRENSKGDYNTPFNWEARIINENTIREKIYDVVDVFKKFSITFTIGSFEDIDFSQSALYYLDPPYINEIEAMENAYHKDAFNLNKQLDLINLLRGKCYLYSNHYNDNLITAFENIGYKSILKINRKNIISASKESRKNDKIEILVKNY